MELGIGRPLFARFASKDFAQMAAMLEQAATLAQNRADRLAGVTRQHVPTEAEPVIVLVIDELANLTSYLTDRHLKDRIKQALSTVLSQGRAVGVHVVAAIQDPRKDVLPFRNLFPTCGSRSRVRWTWSSATGCATGARCATGSRSRRRVSGSWSSMATRPRSGSGSPT
jgi:hypothetical protein